MNAFPYRARAALTLAAGASALLSGACAARESPPAPRAAVGRVELRLADVPAGLPPGAVVHVAGSFNGWNPGDPAYRLTARPGGAYSVALPEQLRGRRIEFKFTLGSWETVETDAAGGDVPNRSFTVPEAGPAAYSGSVPAWRDPSVPRPPAPSTATASVSVLSDTFAIPELGRTRRVWIYLPPGYAASAERYPVLYVHDGQNLFDAATSFAGEWGVDETLDSLHARGDRGVIVVGVDNGGARRFDEYSPWAHPEHGGGDGDAYVDFLVGTLKPYVDRHYRTRPGRLHTAVAGSSMGGVISLYAALKHPEVFGAAGVFSPALWVTPPLYGYARAFDPERPRPRLYFVSGGLEGSTPGAFVRDQRRMVETLAAAGFETGADVQALVRDDGTHTEGFWRREFPAAYDWLFAGARAGGAPGEQP